MARKQFVPMYDLASLSEEQKQEYVKAVCDHLEIPPELNLVRLIWSDEGDGARRQVAYVLKGATDIIREKRKITTESLTSLVVGGSIIFTATGKDSQRQEIAVGAHAIDGLKGKALDNAIMTAQTRATRRMTLQFVGGGVLDESEIVATTTNITSQSTPLSQLALSPQPTVKPNDAAGKDVTEAIQTTMFTFPGKALAAEIVQSQAASAPGKDKPLSAEELKKGAETVQQAFATAFDLVTAQHPEAGKAVELAARVVYQTTDRNATLPPHSGVNLEVIEAPAPVPILFKGTSIPLENIAPGKKEVSPEQLEGFEKTQEKLRADAIAQLNAKEKVEGANEPTEPKKRRGRKTKVDLNSPGQVEQAAQPPALVVPVVSVPQVSAPVAPVISQAPVVATVLKPRLTQEQVKPFRQRLFRLQNDYLEPAGFAPKEGMGNADKMRAFANVMFPEVTNMNELTVEQWEKYLVTLEQKVQKEGAAAVVKYIEDAIGL